MTTMNSGRIGQNTAGTKGTQSMLRKKMLNKCVTLQEKIMRYS